jgi:2-dehydro-3-deoxygalactonokinase
LRSDRLSLTETVLLADWGTTTRRAWLLDASGKMLASAEDRRGMATIEPDGWEAAFEDLKRLLGDAEPSLSLLAGMVGSRSGWCEAHYLSCPVALPDLADELCWVVPGEVAIVPGVCILRDGFADVMRGEETQVLGAVDSGLVERDCFVCLPGTHTKWVAVAGGQVTHFRTVMTGELFALLQASSTLAAQIAGTVEVGPDFEAGVDRGLEGGSLTAEIFAVRAHALLDSGRIADGAAYLSGLLIGADLRAGLTMAEHRAVDIIGRSDLAALYSHAVLRSGRKARVVDGATAVVAGLRHLAELAA